MGNEVTVGVLQAVLRLKDELTPAINQMTQNVGNAAKGITSTLGSIGTAIVGAFSISAISNFVHEFTEWGSQLVDFSNRMGISITAVQQFKFAAEQGGSSIQAIARAMDFMQRSIGSGDKGFAEILGRIGVNFDLLKRLQPEQQFIMLARALNDVTDPALKAAAAQELFGRSGQELKQVLPTILEDLRDFVPASEHAAKAADDIGDAWDRFIQSLQNSVAGDALGTVLDLITFKIRQAASEVRAITDAFSDETGMAGAVNLAEAGITQLRENGFVHLGVSMKEANQIEKEIEANIKKTNKAREEAIQAMNRQDAAFRQTMNFVGEQQMKADKAQMDLDNAMFAMIRKNNPQLLVQSSNLPTEQLLALPGVVKETIQLVPQVQSVWVGVFNAMRQSAADNLAAIMLGAQGFKEGFINIWHSIRQSLMDIVSDLLNNVLGGLMRGIGSMLGGGSFGAGFGGIGGMLGGLFGGGGGAAAGAGGAAAGAGGGGMGALGALMTNPWTIGIAGALGLGTAIWRGGLFRGGEEALKVNPARDQFLSQFGDPSNKDVGGAGHNLAALLTEITGEAGGGALFRALQSSDTMKEFEAAVKNIEATLSKGSQTATTDTAQLKDVSAQGSAAVNSLSAAISGLAGTAAAAASAVASPLGALPGGTPLGGLAGGAGFMDPNRPVQILDENGNVIYSGGGGVGSSIGGRVPQFARGSGGFKDFGKGTLAMLHGKERVMTEGENAGLSLSINIGDVHVGTGDSSEVRRAAAMGVLDALESGGPAWSKFRILATQAVG